MTACPAKAILEVGDTYEHPAHDVLELNCDIAVVGAGGAGLVAAARIASSSDKKVIVLEKMPFIGGGLNFASDWRIYGSDWQKRHNIPDLTNEKIQAAMDATNWQLDHELVYQAYANTGKFFDWFEKICPDVEYREAMYIFDRPHGGQHIPLPVNRQGMTSCRHIVSEKLQEYCRKVGVDIRTRHQVTDVEMTDGRISAVIAKDPGGITKVHCKSLILASGSWISDKKLMAKICPDFLKMPIKPEAHTSLAYTGDGIPMAQKLGAYIDYGSLCLRLMGPMGMAPGATASVIARSPSCIFVNKNGKRWINEDTIVRKDDAFGIAHVLVKQPQGVSYTIFEANMADKLYKAMGGKPIQCKADEPMPPSPIPDDYREDLKLLAQPGGVGKIMEKMMAEMAGPGGPGGPGGPTPGGPGNDDGFGFYAAATLEELAEKAGIDPAGLRETVDNYNAMCDAGFDKEFFKNADQLIPFGDGPFYAVRGQLATDGAFGGIQVDKDTRAYADQEKTTVVPGLYVPGDFSASRFINNNGVKVQVINDLAWAVSSGFSAADAAVADLK
jgi:fumarate reductase flavoprotein subunit